MKVISREGNLMEFDSSKIFKAIKKAFNACNQNVDDKVIWEIVNEISIWDEITVEDIQDQVMEVLRDYGYSYVADEYLIYKYKHAQARQLAENKQEFIQKYKESSNTANATVDDNSNVANKNIGILNAEGHKEENILVNRAMVANKLKTLFPDFPYKSYYQDLRHHIIYKHDESSFIGAIAPYCCSISMYPFLNNGIKGLGGLSAKPKNIDSFCGMFINLMFAVAGQFAGAVATSEFLMYFDYFCRKEWGDDYYQHFNWIIRPGSKLLKILNGTHYWCTDINELRKYDFGSEEYNKLRDEIVYDSERPLTKDELEEYNNKVVEGIYDSIKTGDGTRTLGATISQLLQQVIYSVNQPAAARGMQSVFWNISLFDKPFFDAMFGNFMFPDFTAPQWDSLYWLQKEFMKWFNAERLKCILTFPVVSVALIYKDGEFLDKNMAELVAQEYSEGNSFFTYISDTADSLSSCCRLKNKIQTKEFNFTNGNMGVETGSKSVLTLNLNRIIQDCCRVYGITSDNWIDNISNIKLYLSNILERIYKYHIAYNESLWDMYDAELLPAYNEGFISLDKQYLTIGINGLNQSAEFLGITCNDNPLYMKYCQFIFSTIKELNTAHNGKFNGHTISFNTECVPAESLAIKNYNWDKEEGYKVPEDTNLYASYIFKPNDPNISILEKIRLHGKNYIGDYLDGGSSAHLNLSEHLSKEQYRKLLKVAAENGCQYFTFNIPNTECGDCGFIAKYPFDKCPKCGSTHVYLWDRIIGYLTKIANWSDGRQKEQKTRVYSKLSEVC